ncbi:MAG: TonB-dependent receptor, partial [Planctomycetes bacterium]|nr:TonB-dependent receptor [Planctomycetota bacterium]
GEGYRAPKPIEFDDPWVGNPDLTSERSASFDVGAEQEFLGGDLVLGVTWFSLRTRDLIAWDPESMILENFARARVRGAEFEVVGRPADGLLLRAWFTRQHPKDLSGGGRLPGRPRWYSGGEARWTSGDLTLSLGVEAAGDHPGTGKIDPDGDVRRHPGKRLLVALRASYAATEWLSLHARVENLLDRDWYATEVSPPGNGIGFVLGVEGTF